MDIKEYKRKWFQEHKEEYKEKRKIYAKRYYEKHKEEINVKRKEYQQKNKEKINERAREYRKNNPEKIKAIHEKFKEKNDWVSYCEGTRRKRVERLRAQGCINAWMVAVKGDEPKYAKEVKLTATTGSQRYFRLSIPKVMCNKLGLELGDAFEVKLEKNQIIFTKKENNNE